MAPLRIKRVSNGPRYALCKREVADSKLSRGQIILQLGLGTDLATANRGVLISRPGLGDEKVVSPPVHGGASWHEVLALRVGYGTFRTQRDV